MVLNSLLTIWTRIAVMDAVVFHGIWKGLSNELNRNFKFKFISKMLLTFWIRANKSEISFVEPFRTSIRYEGLRIQLFIVSTYSCYEDSSIRLFCCKYSYEPVIWDIPHRIQAEYTSGISHMMEGGLQIYANINLVFASERKHYSHTIQIAVRKHVSGSSLR